MITLDLNTLIQIAVAAIITDLFLLVGHWFRWDLWLGRELPRIAAYVYGMLSILVPVTVLLMIWQLWPVVLLLWISTVTGGIVVVIAYFTDEHAVLKKKESISIVEKEILYGEIEEK